jgi:hypothetical protein
MPTNTSDVVEEAREMADDYRYDIQPRIREALRALCDEVEALRRREFRTRAVNLCREKAEEWKARIPNSDDETFKYHYQTRADAATELADLLEQQK